jgi:pseudoazurin
MLINRTHLTGLAVAGALLSGSALADVVEVMAVVTKFEPMVVFVKPGDSVKFSNMAGHDTVSIEGMIPEGGQTWKSTMGEEITVKLDTPGAYVYQCSPHVGLGMVGAIVVGEASNLEAIKASPHNKGMVGRTVRELEKQVQAHK